MLFGIHRVRGAVLALLCVAVIAAEPAFSAPVPASARTPAAAATPSPAQAPAPTIVSVSVSGNTHVPTDRIMAVVKSKVGDRFNPQIVQEDLQNIFNLGYFADQVPPLIRARPGGVSITYRVIENPVITRITFSGNAHVPADTLLALMDTAVGQVFNTNTFHQDVLKINSYYDKIGYGGQVPSHVPDLNVDAASGVLALKIQEGLTVRNVVIAGDPILPPNVIIPALAVKAGQPYSEELRDKDIENVKKLYEKYDLSLGDFEAGIDPATVDLKNGTADVRYTISAARVGAVQITGNTITKDEVIRRELRLRPGMIITQAALRRDYERLNNIGFFEKVDLNVKAGPDPKKPAYVTIDWDVKEQRTGTASIGAGYSGGPTGEGLTGTLSFSQNNINGTGNGATVSFQKGSRITDEQVSVRIPYVGKTKQSQKYSFGASVFSNSQSYYYPVYSVPGATPAPGATASALPAGTATSAPIPVTIVPINATNPQQVTGVVANYASVSTGLSLNIGRRFTDFVTGTLGLNVQRVSSSATVPSGYVFNSSGVASPVLGPTAAPSNPFSVGSNTSGAQALGITASSIAAIDSTRPYNLRSITLGLSTDTRDDVFNPRRGTSASLSDEISGRGIGSDFNYTLPILEATRFFPLLKNATLGFHLKAGTTTGAIPPNRLYTLSQTELRAYKDVFYGTNLLLFQSEFRFPLTADRKFAIAAFVDQGGVQIRGANPVTDASGNVLALPGRWVYRGDFGAGLRFDVPQLGLHTIRLDYAIGKGQKGISFGIGQSF